MKRVIDIPEETFRYYVTLANKGEQIGNLERIILDSAPLPEHHGRIIDESQISRIELHTERELYGDKIRYVKVTDAPTIIEGSENV